MIGLSFLFQMKVVGASLVLRITSRDASLVSSEPAQVKAVEVPVAAPPSSAPKCRYVNAVLTTGVQASGGVSGTHATVLLENPAGERRLTGSELTQQVRMIHLQA